MNRKMLRCARNDTAIAAVAVAAAVAAVIALPAYAKPAVTLDSGTISGLGARNIGSATMSGRIAAIAAHEEKDGKTTVFVGSASGGVWKSTDGGVTYDPKFDHEPVQSIGAVAIDPRDAQTVWVGSGEAWTRNSASIGDGVYKSTDGGDTWTNVGLKNSERIAKIVVHPKDGNTVFACVAGKLWSDSTDRGLYKTTDGGKTWSLALKGMNASTGCSALSMDPQNPDVLYAALWDFRRKGWTFRSGGDDENAPSGSGLHVSRDGGKTWTEFSADRNKGFPAKPFGRIAVAVAPSNPKVLYATIEATKGAAALYRSDDGGATWEARDKSQFMVWRPFYFANLIVDPTNADRVFKTGGSLLLSEDGGKSFARTGGFAGAHGDVHDVWISPSNPKFVMNGDDGGMWYSKDGGTRWLKGENLPVSQFYHVSVDNEDPYRVYGGLQDNSSWVGDSQYPGGITNSRWENMFGGDGFWMFADPTDPDYLYAEYQGGNAARVNRKTHEARLMQPLAGYHEKMRMNWNTPIHLSKDGARLYMGAQFLFRSKDRGASWERISPDLTTNDPQKQKQEESGGVTIDNSAAEMHTTIYSICESPKNAELVWVGTDDGNVQITRDGGKRWKNVVGNVPGLPKNSWVSWVQASRFDEGTAYATFDRHTFGDMKPYVFKTTDYGATWKQIAGDAQGLRGYAHVVREDSVKKDLLFVGTEFGLWISPDGGKRWAQYKGGNFPAVAVRDLVVQERDSDLVLATHGRGIWIIDDITPLRELSDALLDKELQFVSARPSQQRLNTFGGGWPEGAGTFYGDNPPDGAVINYYQKSRHLFGKIKLEILDPEGKVIDTVPASKRRGLNRVYWSMRAKAPRVPPAAQVASNSTQGPRYVPGNYKVRLTKNGQVYETTLPIVLDSRAKFDLGERKENFAAAERASGLFGEMSDVVAQVNGLRGAIAQRKNGLGADDPLAKKLSELDGKADDVRKKIVATKEGGAITGEERLREHMDNVYGPLMSYEGRPTPYQTERIDVLARELGDVQADWKKVLAIDLPTVNEMLRGKGAQPIEVSLKSGDDVASSGGGPSGGDVAEALRTFRLR